MAFDNSFVLSLLCYHWLSFHRHESSLHGSLHDICWLFAFVFSLGCVYLCSYLPCTFVGWVPILDFDLWGFSSLYTGIQGWNRKIKFKLPQVLINAELYGLVLAPRLGKGCHQIWEANLQPLGPMFQHLLVTWGQFAIQKCSKLAPSFFGSWLLV